MIIILGLFLAACAAAWVHNDAKNIEEKVGGWSPLDWAVLTFFFMIIGLPLYLFKRGEGQSVTIPRMRAQKQEFNKVVNIQNNTNYLVELERLAEFRDRKIITNDEFERKKAELLQRNVQTEDIVA